MAAILYVVCALGNLPAVVLGVFVWLTCLPRRTQLRRERGFLVLVPPPRSWVAKRWRYSITLGHLVVLNPEHDGIPMILRHEGIHVQQFEVINLLWAVVCLASWRWWLVVLWPLAWLISYACAALVAALHGKRAYEDNMFEAHARDESGQH